MKLFLAIILSLTVFSLAHAQGSSGGGGSDNLDPKAHVAWFQGNRPIRYCIDLAPTFSEGMTVEKAKLEIESVFQIWANYLERKHVLEDRAKVYGSNYMPIVTHTEFTGSCTGKEDLKFYLGTTSRAIETERRHYDNPVSFAHKETYSEAQGWSSGYIWLAPDYAVLKNNDFDSFPLWRTRNELKAILMHEIGHVLGNGHIPGTIMDARLSETIHDLQSADKMREWKSHVDGASVLYTDDYVVQHGNLLEHNKELQWFYPSGHRRKSDLVNEAFTFKLFTGREPTGEIKSEFTMKPHLTLTLIDTKGSYSIPLLQSDTSSIQESAVLETKDELIFGQILPDGSIMWQHQEIGVAYIFARDASGNTRTLTVEYNIPSNGVSSPLQIRYFDGTTRRMLFQKDEE